MTKEELKGTKIWFGDDIGLMTKIINKYKEFGIEFCCSKGEIGCICVFPDFTFGIYEYTKEGYNSDDYKEITPSQLLGETEEWEPKIGDWIYAEPNVYKLDYPAQAVKVELVKHDGNGWCCVCGFKGKDGSIQKLNTLWSFQNNKILRPALPEEIPQEEVEYVECIKEVDVNGGAIKGDIYPVKHNGRTKEIITKSGERICDLNSPIGYTNFKPSTREAYEAQEKNQFKIHIEAVNNLEGFVGLFNQLEKVNKCSTINKQENECNENKGVILPRKSYDFPRGKRKEGSKIQLTGRVFPSKGRS